MKRKPLTVGELRAALAQFDDAAPVLIEGTSVAVRPLMVWALPKVRLDADVQDWAYEGAPDDAVVILTDGSVDYAEIED